MKKTWRLMNIFAALAGLTLLSGGAALAEEFPRGEVFGGYSYARVGELRNGLNVHGWGASVSGNVNQYFGLTADFGGHYQSFTPLTTALLNVTSKASSHEFLFGPRVTARGQHVTGFAHFLLGAARLKTTTSAGPAFLNFSDVGFAMGLGGGLDVNVGKNVALRVAQVDYVPVRVQSEWSHNMRYAAGIVFKF